MSGEDDTGEGGASAIVAYEATRRGRPSNVLVFTFVECASEDTLDDGISRFVFFKNDPTNNKS